MKGCGNTNPEVRCRGMECEYCAELTRQANLKGGGFQPVPYVYDNGVIREPRGNPPRSEGAPGKPPLNIQFKAVNEFVLWLDGFIDAVIEVPTKDQWGRLQEAVKRLKRGE